ncbi:MAG: hypothetical protein IJT43_04080 [Stomatobaculum sp.]|nr:hypothetical protein [Stomatobaculum sp.]
MKLRQLMVRGAVLMTVLAALAGLQACGKKGNLRESVVASLAAEETPDTEIHEGIQLDFDEAQSTAEELVDDFAEEYPLNDYIDTYVDEERKIVNLIWPLQNEATEKDAVRYGTFLIKAFNDACAQQDFSIRVSDENYYGGLYEDYSINLQVFRGSDILKPENYLVSMIIPAGAREKVVPFSEYNGIAEVMMTEGPEWIPGGNYTGDYTAYVESASAEYESAEAVRKQKNTESGNEAHP